MAHVLIATDMSEGAFNAALYAIQLYGAEGNTFTLLNTYQAPPQLDELTTTPAALQAQISVEGLQEFAQRLLERLPEPAPDLATVSAYGALHDVLQMMADDQEQAPELVALGTHSTKGIERILMGSTTAAVINHCPVPVLAVPLEARYRAPQRIVLADDGGPVERATLKVLLDIARWSRAEVKIVHVVPEGPTAKHEVVNSGYDMHLGAIPHSYHSVSGDDVMLALSDLADQSDTDLAVVVHRHRGLIDQLFHHSVATDLALHTHLPLLVLQQQKG